MSYLYIACYSNIYTLMMVLLDKNTFMESNDETEFHQLKQKYFAKEIINKSE